jgi:hypothetical protein
MGEILRIIILLLGTIFMLTVIYLLIKKKITEKNSMLWLGGSVIAFIISIKPSTIDKLADLIGVDYPPTLLFLFSILIILFINLYHSVQISSLSAQVKELTQHVAVTDSVISNKYVEIKVKEIEKDYLNV